MCGPGGSVLEPEALGAGGGRAPGHEAAKVELARKLASVLHRIAA